MRIRLVIYSYKCAKCGQRHQDVELPGDPYGEFILKSRNREKRYLFAIGDEVFNEFTKLVRSREASKHLDDFETGDLIQKHFKSVCDFDSKGDPFILDENVFCPYCGSNSMKSWGEIHPLQYVEEDLHPTTYEKWNSLNTEEKIKIVDKAIEEGF